MMGKIEITKDGSTDGSISVRTINPNIPYTLIEFIEKNSAYALTIKFAHINFEVLIKKDPMFIEKLSNVLNKCIQLKNINFSLCDYSDDLISNLDKLDGFSNKVQVTNDEKIVNKNTTLEKYILKTIDRKSLSQDFYIAIPLNLIKDIVNNNNQSPITEICFSNIDFKKINSLTTVSQFYNALSTAILNCRSLGKITFVNCIDPVTLINRLVEQTHINLTSESVSNIKSLSKQLYHKNRNSILREIILINGDTLNHIVCIGLAVNNELLRPNPQYIRNINEPCRQRLIAIMDKYNNTDASADKLPIQSILSQLPLHLFYNETAMRYESNAPLPGLAPAVSPKPSIP